MSHAWSRAIRGSRAKQIAPTCSNAQGSSGEAFFVLDTMSDAQSVASKFLKPKPKEEPTMSFAERTAMLMADDDENGAAGL